MDVSCGEKGPPIGRRRGVVVPHHIWRGREQTHRASAARAQAGLHPHHNRRAGADVAQLDVHVDCRQGKWRTSAVVGQGHMVYCLAADTS